MTTVIGPDGGGVGHVTRSLASAWPADPGATELIMVSDEGDVSQTNCGCPRPVGPSRLRATAWRAARSAWHHRACLRASSSLHLELGRVSVGPLWFGLAASLLARRAPLVVTTHDIPVVVLHPAAALVPRRRGFWDRIAYRLIAPLLDRVVLDALRRRTAATVVLSSAAAATARDGGWPAVIQVDHGADPASLTVVTPGQAGYVLLAGYLGPGKGLDVLASAWGQIDCELPLVIAGGHSEHHDAWVRQVKERFDATAHPPVWRGFVDDDTFAELVRDSAVVVIPYEQSNPASGVLVRALVEGRAIVGTRVPALVEEVVDGVNGLLVSPGNPDELAAALSRLAAAPELRDRLGAEAGRRAGLRHAWSTHASTVAAMHHRLLGRQLDERPEPVEV